MKINQGLVSEKTISCPDEHCGCPVNYYTLKGNLDRSIFEKYENFLLNFGLSNQPKNSDERTIFCPSKNCLKISFIQKEAQYFNCAHCGITSCADEKCLGLWSEHKGKTCSEYKEWKELNKGKSDDFIKKFNLRRCPICGSLIEKFGNCNLIRCCSVRCQKKTIFCFLCGEALKEETSLAHFSQNSTFAKCKNLEKNPEVEEAKQFEPDTEIIVEEKICKHQILAASDNDHYTCMYEVGCDYEINMKEDLEK